MPVRNELHPTTIHLDRVWMPSSSTPLPPTPQSTGRPSTIPDAPPSKPAPILKRIGVAINAERRPHRSTTHTQIPQSITLLPERHEADFSAEPTQRDAPLSYPRIDFSQRASAECP